MKFSLSLLAPENVVLRDRFGHPVPRVCPLHFQHTPRLNLVLTHGFIYFLPLSATTASIHTGKYHRSFQTRVYRVTTQQVNTEEYV